MNTKHCVYRNCGNTSASPSKITFFGFPLKDLEKCQHWARMAGCEDIDLKKKYLCENHFSTIYISRTPRRTVLLPNAMPYRYDENINKSENENENYEEDYNSEKNISRDEILLDPMEEENDILYNDTIEIIRQNEDGADENVETLEDALVEEEIQNVAKQMNPDPLKTVKIAQKTYDNSSVGSRVKKVEKIPSNRVSSADNEFVNHVTKRQKLHISADNISVLNQKNETLKKVEECAINEDKYAEFDNTADPAITTFIYEGEQYVQMPKRIYLQERAELYADLKRFQKLFQDIKSLVNSTD